MFTRRWKARRQEIFDALAARRILSANRQDNGFRYEDFFVLAYAMSNGKTNPAMTSEQLWKWAAEFDTLTEEQRKMLMPLIQVNGINYEQLPFPLTREYADLQLRQIIADYNWSAAQLFQAYVNKTF